ncbi:hypothetical protein [Streptomyces sp. NPDC047928]|uniref:hypothetical protein n=1 Tax=unclassified Streptomyces TaxID=2593676 RepID=UPI003716EA1B
MSIWRNPYLPASAGGGVSTSGRLATRQIEAAARAAGRTRECGTGEHATCTPMDVYASHNPLAEKRPWFSITCTCSSHRDRGTS